MSDGPREAGGARRMVVAALFACVAAVYLATLWRSFWTTDVYGADWTAWRIATTGRPWVDGATIHDLGHRSQHLLAIVQAANGHTAFGRFPGVVVASIPAYLIWSGGMSVVPASLTAAVLTAATVTLMFSALRTGLSQRRAVLASLVFAFATPVWTVPAVHMWPHTITLVGIAGMAWASANRRWWWVGVFGGIALWGRLHTAVIVAVLATGLALWRRDVRIALRAGSVSLAFLVASCIYVHWVYGTWNPLGTYGSSAAFAQAGSYRFSLSNQLGMWVAPDRGILVWTPVILLLLPALVRAWSGLPDWSRMLLISGLGYTVLSGALVVFHGGDGFYGYRYGLEMLASATPALALSQHRMGRFAKVCAGPVLAVQFFAFVIGVFRAGSFLRQEEAWHRNAFVEAMNSVGTAGWLITALVALIGLAVTWRLRQPTPESTPVARPSVPVAR